MNAKIIPKTTEQAYPCLVVDDQTGDGSKPTVYFKPNKFISIVVIEGFFSMQMNMPLGHLIDAKDPKVIEDRGLEEGEGIDEDLPLFTGEVVLQN